MKTETVGIAAMRAMKDFNPEQTVCDTTRAMNKGYLEEINKCVNRFPACDWHTPFYVVVITKKERVLHNVIRRYFVARQSLPSPTWDQTVWHYNPTTSDLRHVWTLPDQETGSWLLMYPEDAPKGHGELLSTIHEFARDQLYIRHYAHLHPDDPEHILTRSDTGGVRGQISPADKPHTPYLKRPLDQETSGLIL
jgi:hypothetical protein